MRSTLELTEFTPNTRWAANVIKGPVPYVVNVTLEGKDGGTVVTTWVNGEPTGFFKLAERMVASQLEKSLEQDGLKFKEILEKS